MSDKKIDAPDAGATCERAPWEAPEIRLLDTRDAEAAATNGDDTGVFS